MAEHGLGHIGRVRDWECVTQDGCAEKRALRLAQGDLPDIFFRAALTNEEVASLASAGQLVDLAPMLEQYAPNFSALMERDPTIRLSTYFTSRAVDFITGVSDIEAEWDEYVDTMKSMGIEEGIAICQEAYDNYMAKLNG